MCAQYSGRIIGIFPGISVVLLSFFYFGQSVCSNRSISYFDVPAPENEVYDQYDEPYSI